MTPERQAFKKHQQGYHVREIIGSVFFFFALEVVTALCQGKIIKFQHCSVTYFVAFGGYLVFILVVVLACYKFGIILEGSYARACAGQAPVETGERLHRSTLALFRRATEWIERG